MISVILLVVCLSSVTLADNSVTPPSSHAEHILTLETSRPLPKIDAIYAELVSRRNLQIARLRAYAAAGRFPRNRDFPGQLVPYFVDASDTACAVAHLMRLDDETATVNSIAATNNHVRIESIGRGPIINWIRNSGLTQQECALIQPLYARIEDYRQHPQWRDEQKRLHNHFARVEKTLHVQSQRSLGEALIAKLDAERKSSPESPANDITKLIAALASPERNVRIAAAHLLGSLKPDMAARTPRIEALKPNLHDPDEAVAFWTAMAIENIGSSSLWGEGPSPGSAELHLITLPVFLATLHGDFDELRLPALIQLANIAPESISTNRQLCILPEVRHALVDACEDRDPEVRAAAQKVLESWRWQRTAYESQRMRRHYLAESFDMECLAAETLTLGRSFATSSIAVDELRRRTSIYDSTGGIHFFEPRPNSNLPTVASTFTQASQIVQQNLRSFRKEAPEAHLPDWTVGQFADDPLYCAVKIAYQNDRYTHSSTYLVPRPTLFEVLSKSPHSWLETQHGSPHPAWPATHPSTVLPAQNLQIRLAGPVRNNLDQFIQACDLSASFLTFYARIVLDRFAQESSDSLVWKGRIADLRQYQPRFLEQGGGGSSVYGGGGWDFHQLTMKCDRSTGNLQLAVEPIVYPLKPAVPEIVAPAWTVDELKLMGWKPLRSPDFFGDRLLPPAYHEVAQEFEPTVGENIREKTRSKLVRTWYQDKTLPPPNLILALLYDRAGDRARAIHLLKHLGSDSYRDPAALADVARWELSIGDSTSARKHAEAALKLWPKLPASTEVLKQLTESNAIAN